jgi:cytochrome c-type biogenesis protein CcmH
MLWRVVALLFGALLVCATPAFAGPAGADDHEHDTKATYDATHAAPGERELLGRLVAPCCWNQTLDIHGGAVPDRLRAEIRARLHAGEPAEAIEADFVKRYGPEVKAHSNSSGLAWTSIAVVGLALLAAVFLVVTVRRWLRSGRRVAAQMPATKEPPDAWDARIDDELRALD